jgi:hypothetical protein
MDLDVESLYGRRNDERWNRVAVGDILERMSRSDPDKVAMIAAPDCVADPGYARVTYPSCYPSWPGAARRRCA